MHFIAEAPFCWRDEKLKTKKNYAKIFAENSHIFPQQPTSDKSSITIFKLDGIVLFLNLCRIAMRLKNFRWNFFFISQRENSEPGKKTLAINIKSTQKYIINQIEKNE